MNIKELLQREVPLPINAIKKPFIWICNLKRYISFNLMALIGLIDFFIYVLYAHILPAYPNINQLATPIHWMLFSYFCFSRIFVVLLLFVFIIEKIINFKIRKNIIMDNIIYDVLFCFSLIFQTVTIIFFLWLWITA